MATTRKPLDPLAVIAAQVVAENPELRDRATRIVERAFDEIEFTQEWGSRAEKMRIAQTIMPQVLRSVKSAEAETTDTARRDAYEEMLAEMRGDDPG